jgi:hypothetical protein
MEFHLNVIRESIRVLLSLEIVTVFIITS